MIFFWILFFLVLSALFSGTEIAFVSASKLKVELKRKKGTRKGAILANFYEKPADFLGSLLVGNNIALVVFTYLMTKVLSPLLFPVFPNEALLLFGNTILITLVVLIFGEFFPKTIFRLYADELLYFLAFPLAALRMILRIPAWFMIRFTNLLLRYLLRVPDNKVETAFTRLDLENFVKDSFQESEEDLDTDLFERALYLKKVKVRECMIPRPEIEYIDLKESVDTLNQLFVETKMSRLIVVEDDLDNVIGYVHHQQLLDQPRSISDIVMDIPFVPEAMRVRELMNKFIKERLNIACVVDEYGAVSGIITLEDALEEIFGEIEDEHDQEEYVENQISETEFIFSGRLEIDYLNEKYPGLELPEGEYHTLSGYLVMTTATIPEQGDEILLEGCRFILELVSDTRIETVRVIKLPENVQEESQ
jgi:putative hemolysin